MSRRNVLAASMMLALGVSLLGPTSPAGSAADATDRHSPDVARIDYRGQGIEVQRLSGDQRRLAGTPRSFRRFVRARLDVLFEDAGSKPRCATSPTVVVNRYHGAGWASGGEGWYAPCPGGGYAVIYDRTASGWRQILGDQELRFCQDLAWYGVPRFIAGRTCLNERVKPVRYERGRTATVSPTASARRVISTAQGIPIVAPDEVLSPAASEQLAVLIVRGGYLSLDKCLAAGDAHPAAVHLGDAPRGCIISATYKKGRKERFMLRMDKDLLVTEIHRFA